MAHTNKYYIVKAEDPNLPQIESVIVGLPTTQRYSIDKALIVVKLHKGDSKHYEFLNQYQEYNHEEILEALDNSEWQEPLGKIEIP